MKNRNNPCRSDRSLVTGYCGVKLRFIATIMRPGFEITPAGVDEMIEKRKLSLLLMLVMFAATLPTCVFADEGDTDETAKVPTIKEVEEDDSLDDLLDDLTDEELDKVLLEGMAARLRIERQQVAEEINNGVFYEEEDIERAKAILKDGKNTQVDNINRIIRAFAVVDPVFANLREQLQDNKIQEVMEGAKKILNTNEANYFSAAKHYLYAEAMAKGAKDYWDAIDAYGNIVVNMPDKISFAASASIRTGKLFEEHGRLYYATEQYVYTLKNYALTLSSEEFNALKAKVEENQKIYESPMDYLTKEMGVVEERLDSNDSGDITQNKEDQIVAVLTDLIKVMEEAKKKDPKEKDKPEQGNQKKSGEAKSGGSKPGDQPGGSNNPKDKATSPAQQSYLPEGLAGRIEIQSESRDDGLKETGDWSQLPPRKKQQLTELLQRQLSERNREAIRLYFIKRARFLIHDED